MSISSGEEAERAPSGFPVIAATTWQTADVGPGQLVARPDTIYGIGIGSNYQRQGLKLSKHFRAP